MLVFVMSRLEGTQQKLVSKEEHVKQLCSQMKLLQSNYEAVNIQNQRYNICSMLIVLRSSFVTVLMNSCKTRADSYNNYKSSITIAKTNANVSCLIH